MVAARFPFSKVGTIFARDVYRPYALAEFRRHPHGEPILAEAIIDTGADYTLLPRQYSFVLGIDVKRDCLSKKMRGIGGPAKTYFLKGDLWLRVGDWRGKIPVAFSSENDIPPLLGRLGCLELFRLIFEKHVSLFEV